jgi:hypothetical protein
MECTIIASRHSVSPNVVTLVWRASGDGGMASYSTFHDSSPNTHIMRYVFPKRTFRTAHIAAADSAVAWGAIRWPSGQISTHRPVSVPFRQNICLLRVHHPPFPPFFAPSALASVPFVRNRGNRWHSDGDPWIQHGALIPPFPPNGHSERPTLRPPTRQSPGGAIRWPSWQILRGNAHCLFPLEENMHFMVHLYDSAYEMYLHTSSFSWRHRPSPSRCHPPLSRATDSCFVFIWIYPNCANPIDRIPWYSTH